MKAPNYSSSTVKSSARLHIGSRTLAWFLGIINIPLWFLGLLGLFVSAFHPLAALLMLGAFIFGSILLGQYWRIALEKISQKNAIGVWTLTTYFNIALAIISITSILMSDFEWGMVMIGIGQLLVASMAWVARIGLKEEIEVPEILGI